MGGEGPNTLLIPSPLSLSGLAPLGIKDWNVNVLIMEYD
jgi:hypothetical protein